MSDILNIQPNAGQTPNEDTTFELEGYDTHIQNLEKQYPDEEPIVPEVGEELSPLGEPESKEQTTQPTPTPTDTQQQPTADTTQPEQPVQQEQPETEEFQGNKLFGVGRWLTDSFLPVR